MQRELITEENSRSFRGSKFDDAAGRSAVIEEIFLEIVESLVVFGIKFFQFLVKKPPESDFPAFAFNNALAYRRIALCIKDKRYGIFRHTDFSPLLPVV
jgi:hypothetical protein